MDPMPHDRPSGLTIAAAACALALAPFAVPAGRAQTLNDDKTVKSIVDAEVKTAERPLAEEQQRIADAIGRSRENAERIRKLTNVDELEIVLVPDLSEKASPLAARIEANSDAIDELRETIEGSAIFFHAIDSRNVLLRDIVAVEFGDREHVTVFAAGEPQH